MPATHPSQPSIYHIEMLRQNCAETRPLKLILPPTYPVFALGGDAKADPNTKFRLDLGLSKGKSREGIALLFLRGRYKMQEERPVIIVPEHPGPDTIKVPVVKVFDGDGFLTRFKGFEVTGNPWDQKEIELTARFGFIDAPEMEQPGGREAKDFLVSLIGERWVELVILTKMDTGGSVDRHGRVVCVPFLTQEYAAGEFRTSSACPHVTTALGAPLRVSRNIELEMVINGWAWVLERYGPDQRYLDALEEARREKRGIWARNDNVHPWEFKKQKYRKAAPKLSCPAGGCSGHLVRKSGRFGEFLGCSAYPRCRYSCSLAS